MGFGTRQPTSNDPPILTGGHNPWLEETAEMDAIALVLNGAAEVCQGCGRTVRIHHIDSSGLCPDCRRPK